MNICWKKPWFFNSVGKLNITLKFIFNKQETTSPLRQLCLYLLLRLTLDSSPLLLFGLAWDSCTPTSIRPLYPYLHETAPPPLLTWDSSIPASVWSDMRQLRPCFCPSDIIQLKCCLNETAKPCLPETVQTLLTWDSSNPVYVRRLKPCSHQRAQTLHTKDGSIPAYIKELKPCQQETAPPLLLFGRTLENCTPACA